MNKRSKLLKTVIPRQVVDVLKIKPDDVLQWDKNMVRVKIIRAANFLTRWLIMGRSM